MCRGSTSVSPPCSLHSPRKPPWFQNLKSGAAQEIGCKKCTEFRKYIVRGFFFCKSGPEFHLEVVVSAALGSRKLG